MHVLKERFSFLHNMKCKILEISTSTTKKNIEDTIKSNLNRSKLRISMIQKGNMWIFPS